MCQQVNRAIQRVFATYYITSMYCSTTKLLTVIVKLEYI